MVIVVAAINWLAPTAPPPVASRTSASGSTRISGELVTMSGQRYMFQAPRAVIVPKAAVTGPDSGR